MEQQTISATCLSVSVNIVATDKYLYFKPAEKFEVFLKIINYAFFSTFHLVH